MCYGHETKCLPTLQVLLEDLRRHQAYLLPSTIGKVKVRAGCSQGTDGLIRDLREKKKKSRKTQNVAVL